MGRVVVAGSINMDVVATAERHPRIGETIAGEAVVYFPGGKGAIGVELKAFLAAQGIDLRYLNETAEAHTGTAIITLAKADNTIVVIPGANAHVTADDVAAIEVATGDVAVSQFEIPLPAISAFFKRARAAGASTVLNP